MSESYSRPTHAISRVQQAGFSPSSSVGPTGLSAASNRATQGLNGSFSYQEAPIEDGYLDTTRVNLDDGADSVVDGLASWFGGMASSSGNAYQQAPASRSSLSEDEKKILKHGLSTMEKQASALPRAGGLEAMEPPQIRSSQGSGLSVGYLQAILEGQSGTNLNL